MTTTISLEPLLQALRSSVSAEPSDPGPSKRVDEAPLSLRLQRLWQERGDFSALSEESLRKEQAKEGQDATAEADKADAGDDDAKEEDSKTGNEGEDSQGMTHEELWDLKVSILSGLDLARRDITSALDVLQLLLNPLGALNPPVPEEALALLPESLSATSLHTPLPAPAEDVHLRNTALSFATKASATNTASSVLRSASSRLQRTTNATQAEWTDLIRLNRSGQWPLRARGAVGSSRDLESRVAVDKLAKDVCLSCAIDEAPVQWRQAGLVRFTDRDVKGKGRMEDVYDVPERLEGRRRLRITIKRPNGKTLAHAPRSGDEQDVDGFLTAVQQELCEEELFGQLISEARDSDHAISATRSSLQVSTPAGISVIFEMADLDSLDSEAISDPLPELASALLKLQMIGMYRNRRKAQLGSDRPGVTDAPKILQELLDVLAYYEHVTGIRTLLQTVHDAIASLGIFESGGALFLQIDEWLDAPEDIIARAGTGKLRLGGAAILALGEHTLDFTFSSPGNLAMVLPTRTVTIPDLEALRLNLQAAVRAALLHRLSTLLQGVTKGKDGWQIKPLPAAISAGTRALAHRLEDGSVHAYTSLSVQVVIDTLVRDAPKCSIEVEGVVARRKDEVTTRKTFSSQQLDLKTASLQEWLHGQLAT